MVKLVWRLSGVFMEKTWQIKLPEWFVLILYGDSVESDAFIRTEISWQNHSGDCLVKTWQNKLSENLYITFITSLHAIYIISTYYENEIFSH